MEIDSLYLEVMTDLRKAYKSARKHKANTESCVRCSMELELELDELARSIIDGCYAMRPSICFAVTEPVLREVIAADFRDRIVHHYIFDYLNAALERELIDDCYSCRVGKGTDYGVARLWHHIRACSENYTKECYVLQLDISGYFMHIVRIKLYDMAISLMDRIGQKRNGEGNRLGHLPKHRLIRQLLATVILYEPLENTEIRDRSNLLPLLPASKSLRYAPEGVGLPIGNLTSQMFSNLYMNGFDQWVKRHLKVKHYGRYVDDTYYIDSNPEWLMSLVPQIDHFLQTELDLHLNKNKTRLTEVRKGVTFLGVHVKPFRRYVKGDSYARMRRKAAMMGNIYEKELDKKEVRERLLASTNSMLGVLNHYSSYRLRRKLFASYPMFRFADGDGGMRKFVMNEGKYVNAKDS